MGIRFQFRYLIKVFSSGHLYEFTSNSQFYADLLTLYTIYKIKQWDPEPYHFRLYNLNESCVTSNKVVHQTVLTFMYNALICYMQGTCMLHTLLKTKSLNSLCQIASTKRIRLGYNILVAEAMFLSYQALRPCFLATKLQTLILAIVTLLHNISTEFPQSDSSSSSGLNEKSQPADR